MALVFVGSPSAENHAYRILRFVMSADLQEWVGRMEMRSDQITPAPMAALSATLDRDDPAPRTGDVVPPLWHWLWFLPIHRQSELGTDGHAQRGLFLPPVRLPRRLWAAGEFEFLRPLRVGENLTRTSRIVSVQTKEGRSGPLVFVKVRHEINSSEGVALIEEQDIVYRDHPNPGNPIPRQPADTDFVWRRVKVADEVLLFRYSALTFNGHRIHYDRKYATEVEHYPGLVVHGPLVATLLADLLRCSLPKFDITRFAFRAVNPLFDTEPFSVCGKPEPDGKTVRLWAANASGGLAMNASATLG
jgi:3-methylfumaryl-CoA hydratase